MNVVIFSLDRAAQLDALLRSYKMHCGDWDKNNTVVLAKCSGGPMREGYQRVMGLHNDPSIKWVWEPALPSSFKQFVLSSLDLDHHKLTMFLVDDIVFKDGFSTSDPEFNLLMSDQRVLCLSLRLWNGITYCYPTDSSVTPPLVQPNGVFTWTGSQGDWGYPMSLDGHVFRTTQIKYLLSAIAFHNPNTMESKMAESAWWFAQTQPSMVCYPYGSKLVNIPANRVQNTCLNRVGNTATTEQLNEEFLAGKRLNTTRLIKYPNNAPHMELSLMWEQA